ncbi:hypothetical protein GCM10009785_12540 [Brooklawnia cerclae]|uniref:hypothetical protein n=1 Tax=Brooklawnia cerclae TaxID=349934 RepID=UPI0031DA7C80
MTHGLAVIERSVAADRDELAVDLAALVDDWDDQDAVVAAFERPAVLRRCAAHLAETLDVDTDELQAEGLADVLLGTAVSLHTGIRLRVTGTATTAGANAAVITAHLTRASARHGGAPIDRVHALVSSVPEHVPSVYRVEDVTIDRGQHR